MQKGEMVYQKLFEDIMLGRLLPGEKLPRGTVLAEQYQVAHLTMRRVLERLQRDGLVNVRRGTGIFVSNLSVFEEVILITDYMTDRHALFPRPLQIALASSGFVLNVFDVRELLNKPGLWRMLTEKSCQYLIFDASRHFPMDKLGEFPAAVRKIAFNRFEHSQQNYPCETILCDVVQAGYQSADALVKNGKKRIAVIGEKINDLKSRCGTNFDYMCGVRKRLSEEGLAAAKFDFSGCLTESDAMEWLAAPGGCDGILSNIDYLLVPFVEAAQKLNLRIPDDVAIIGRGDTPFAKNWKLTSIDVQPELLAKKLVTAIRSASPVKMMIPPKMVFRASCPKK